MTHCVHVRNLNVQDVCIRGLSAWHAHLMPIRDAVHATHNFLYNLYIQLAVGANLSIHKINNYYLTMVTWFTHCMSDVYILD